MPNKTSTFPRQLQIQDEQYFQLVQARKSCRICMNTDPGKIFNGAETSFDSPVVSYWSQWLGHQNPDLLIVGQDFSDRGYFETNRGADDAKSLTNTNLHRLLTIAGFSPKEPPNKDTETKVYLTNSILCLKEPPINRPIAGRWVKACAKTHLRPLIKQLNPQIVVGMGAHGWTAVGEALEIIGVPKTIGAAVGEFWSTPSEIKVFAVGHCGPLGLANRKWAKQECDWRKIG